MVRQEQVDRYRKLVARLEAMQANHPERFQGQARLEAARRKLAQYEQKVAASGGSPVAAPVAIPDGLADPLSSAKVGLSNMQIPSWLPAAGVAAGAAAVVGAGVAGAVALSRRPRRKSSGKSSRKGTKSRSRPGSRRGKPDRNRRGGAVKDKYRGSKVYRTKRGQPYIILGSGPMKGRARFIRA